MPFADGDIPVSRSILPEGEAGVDATVEKMVEMAKGQYGARSAKIRALAINIVNAAKVADKDYFGMIRAIHNWVRDEIRYVRDPIGQETLSYPEEMAFNTRAGDCDDKSILEMALVGSLGIQSYPVVVGMAPGQYSHVYVHIVVPPGRHRYAGQTIAADPIMREWPLGKEVSASKVKAKKLYSELAGLGMNLGSYAVGPAYIDQQNVDSVAPALRSKLIDTGARGRIMNTAEVTRPSDDLDSMFIRGGSPMMAFSAASRRDLHSLGPITARAAQLQTSFLDEIRPRPLRERTAGPHVVTVANKHRVRKQDVVTVRELKGLGDYLAAIEPLVKRAATRQTVTGKNDVLFKAAAAHSLASQRARQAAKHGSRIRYAVGMFGLGADVVSGQDIQLADAITKLANAVAEKAARLAKASTGGAPERERVLRQTLHKLGRADALLDLTGRVARNVSTGGQFPAQDAAMRVATVAEMVHDSDVDRASNAVERAGRIVAEEAAPQSPIRNPMAPGAIVRDRTGATVYDDESGAAGLGFSLKKTFKKIKKTADKVVPEAHLLNLTRKAVAKVATKSPLVKPLAKIVGKDKIASKVLGLKVNKNKRPSVSTANGQTVYQDGDGNVITKAQYDALIAAINAEQAAYNSAIAKLSASAQNGQKPALTTAEIAVLQKYDAPNYAVWQQMMAAVPQTQTMPAVQQNASAPIYYGGSSYNGSSSSMPVPQSSQPIDTFGPEDMGVPSDGNSFSDQTVNATGYDDPSGDASEGSLYASESGDGSTETAEATEEVQFDEDGNPISPVDTAAPAEEPASGGGMTTLALVGAAAWYFLGKKH